MARWLFCDIRTRLISWQLQTTGYFRFTESTEQLFLNFYSFFFCSLHSMKMQSLFAMLSYRESHQSFTAQLVFILGNSITEAHFSSQLLLHSWWCTDWLRIRQNPSYNNKNTLTLQPQLFSTHNRSIRGSSDKCWQADERALFLSTSCSDDDGGTTNEVGGEKRKPLLFGGPPTTHTSLTPHSIVHSELPRVFRWMCEGFLMAACVLFKGNKSGPMLPNLRPNWRHV